MRHDVVDELVAKHIPPNAYPEQWDTAGLQRGAAATCSTSTCRSQEWAKEEGIADEEVTRAHRAPRRRVMAAKVAKWGPDVMR